MSRIRLRYTGILMFSSNILSYLIGAVFAVYVARTLSVAEYGLYGFIGGIWSTFLIFSGLLPFWATRMIARGGSFTKTSFISNILMSIPPLLFFLILLNTLSSSLQLEPTTILIASLYIPINYGISGLNAYLYARKPDKLAFNGFISSITKISIGILLVYVYGLPGAILTIVLGLLFYAIFAFRESRSNFEREINFNIVKEWFKGSWFIFMLSLSVILYPSLDVLFLGFTGLVEKLGSYYAAKKIASLIGMPSGLGIALSPLLLSEIGGEREIKKTMDLTLMFSIPMVAGAILLSKQLVYILGSKYILAVGPLIVLSMAKFLDLLSNLASKTIFGLDKVDAYFKIPFKKLLRSRMFKVNLLNYTSITVEVALLFTLTPIYGLNGVALAILASAVVSFLSKFIMAFKGMKILDLRSTSKYIFSTLVMSIFLVLIPKGGSVLTISTVLIAGTIYFSVLYLIDLDFRILVKAGIKEIAEKFKL